MILDEGLRARKQRETRETIHRVAVKHALAGGPDCVTVADISAEANVSTRTFFNYFPSKEDAMLGFHDDLPADEDLVEFARVEHDDLLGDTVELMKNVFSAEPTNSEYMNQRRSLLRAHPQLMQRQMTRVYAVEQRIAAVVAERMRGSAAFSTVSDIDASARMLTMLATNILRFTIRQATTGSAESSDDTIDQLLERSIKILREVVTKL